LRIQEIAWNLVSNAVKFTPQDGSVVVSLYKENQQAILVVEDNGRGIDGEFLPHVFEMFRQEQAGITRAYGGLGIGLALVKELVELHEGQVEALSDGVGRGSRFVVRLALHTATTSAETAKAAADSEGELADAHILIVDDSRDALEMLRLLLTGKGVMVVTALSGEEGLRVAEQSDFALILSDISMPMMDGYEFLRRLRENPRYSETPAIALTGFGREEDLERAHQAGYTAHITKPINFASLMNLVKIALRRFGPD
jgi:two-component system CheB/CheR fusion protein